MKTLENIVSRPDTFSFPGASVFLSNMQTLTKTNPAFIDSFLGKYITNMMRRC